jgi:hypothetical protein
MHSRTSASRVSARHCVGMRSPLPQGPAAISDVWVLTRVQWRGYQEPVPALSRTLSAERGESAGGSRACNRSFCTLGALLARPPEMGPNDH